MGNCCLIIFLFEPDPDCPLQRYTLHCICNMNLFFPLYKEIRCVFPWGRTKFSNCYFGISWPKIESSKEGKFFSQISSPGFLQPSFHFFFGPFTYLNMFFSYSRTYRMPSASFHDLKKLFWVLSILCDFLAHFSCQSSALSSYYEYLAELRYKVY